MKDMKKTVDSVKDEKKGKVVKKVVLGRPRSLEERVDALEADLKELKKNLK